MDSPHIPDPNQAAQAGAIADVANFPFKAYIDALAQTGGKATINGQTYDFTGLGNAQQNAQMSDKMAQALLDIQKNYGSGYIQQRLRDLQQADPNGYAARKQLFDKIISDAQANPNRPMAQDLQNEVQSLLGQGSNLTTGPGSETEQVQQQVRGHQVGNGIFLGNAPAAQEADAVVNAGDAQQQSRQKEALDFLGSGVSPEDVTYRRIQQSLSNLGNAINGTTPQAEFGSLTGAQGGAAPFNPGSVSEPGLNPNAGLYGMKNAADIYSGNVNWSATQANPWTVGLSTLTNGASALKSMGYNPFSTGATGVPGAGGSALLQVAGASPGSFSFPAGATDVPVSPTVGATA